MALWTCRTARALVALAVLPAAVLAPISDGAILLHKHRGEALHFHTLGSGVGDDVDEAHSDHGHRYEDPACTTVDEWKTLLVVLTTPYAKSQRRLTSSAASPTSTWLTAPVSISIAGCTTASVDGPCASGRVDSCLASSSTTARILTLNHSLLL